MSGDVKIKGLAELDALLKGLPANLERNHMRAAMRAGAGVLRDEARQNVRVASGKLRDGLKVSTSAKAGVVRAKVRTTGKHAFLASWLEYGTAAHKIVARLGGSLLLGSVFLKSVDHPGSRPKPFMRPALDTKGQAAVLAVANKLKSRLTKQGLQTPDIEVDE